MSSPAQLTQTPLSAKRQSTRARLLDAAYEVFARDGVGQASVDAIVEQAGFTRGAFYSNFDTKNDLFAALAVRENERRLAQVRAARASVEHAVLDPELPTDRMSVLEELADEFLSWQHEDAAWLTIEQEVRLLAMRDNEFGRYVTEHREALDAELCRILTEQLSLHGMRFTIAPAGATAIIVSTYVETLVRGMMAGEHGEARRLLIDAVGALTARA